MRPLTILFTYYPRDPEWDLLQAIHHALVCHHNPGVPVVPLVCNGAEPFLPGTVDIGRLDDPMYYVDQFPVRWWQHNLGDLTAERYAVVESDTLVTTSLLGFYREAWDADVAASVVATPENAPGWEWWREMEGMPFWEDRAGVMPSGVLLYSPAALFALSGARGPFFAELRIGTVVNAWNLTLAAVPGMSRTVHCRPELIELSDAPGVYHPVKVFGGPHGECRRSHEFGMALLNRGGSHIPSPIGG